MLREETGNEHDADWQELLAAYQKFMVTVLSLHHKYNSPFGPPQDV
jgi:hypothetical protein